MDDRVPWLYRVVAARRGQSEPMGLLFIIALTVMASGVIVVLGGQALQDTQTQSANQRGEHVMTLFDSRAAAVALSDSSGQQLEFPESGTHTVREGTGWIRINHTNYNGNGNTEILYNGTMGSVTYESGDTTIAYQGGGVWRLGPSGEAQVVSQPEFHYRGSTLTLPIIRVFGAGSVSGAGTASIRPVDRAVPVFPDVGANYGGVPDKAYLNPAENGTMNVTVHSRYYEGWAEHFRSRTDGDVTVDHDAQTATVQLLSLGDVGDFDMPVEAETASGDDEILVRGLSGEHDLQNFNITLFADEDDNASLSNLQWSMYAEEGQKQLELHVRKDSGDKYRTVVYYSTDGGEHYHGWRSVDTITTRRIDVDDDGDKDKALVVNWTDDRAMEYTTLSSDDVVHFDNPGNEELGPTNDDGNSDPITWDEHPADNGVTFDVGDTTTSHNVTNHYFALMGDEWDLQVDDGENDGVEEGNSYGNIEYPGSDRFITYLHVTENEIEVSLN